MRVSKLSSKGIDCLTYSQFEPSQFSTFIWSCSWVCVLLAGLPCDNILYTFDDVQRSYDLCIYGRNVRLCW